MQKLLHMAGTSGLCLGSVVLRSARPPAAARSRSAPRSAAARSAGAARIAAQAARSAARAARSVAQAARSAARAARSAARAARSVAAALKSAAPSAAHQSGGWRPPGSPSPRVGRRLPWLGARRSGRGGMHSWLRRGRGGRHVSAKSRSGGFKQRLRTPRGARWSSSRQRSDSSRRKPIVHCWRWSDSASRSLLSPSGKGKGGAIAAGADSADRGQFAP
mmetsp:Transcript_114182/g.357058  ORF Transcript_114182/g.357058 Transcript_114182/m.357058 type:complete len:219 (-) Transcript_114182:397-1053(-)